MSTEISQALLKSRFTYNAGFLYKEGKKIGLCPDKNGYGKLTIFLKLLTILTEL
jgi:hypothetical protein